MDLRQHLREDAPAARSSVWSGRIRIGWLGREVPGAPRESAGAAQSLRRDYQSAPAEGPKRAIV